jgi:hypothetical protein
MAPNTPSCGAPTFPIVRVPCYAGAAQKMLGETGTWYADSAPSSLERRLAPVKGGNAPYCDIV